MCVWEGKLQLHNWEKYGGHQVRASHGAVTGTHRKKTESEDFICRILTLYSVSTAVKLKTFVAFAAFSLKFSLGRRLFTRMLVKGLMDIRYLVR